MGLYLWISTYGSFNAASAPLQKKKIHCDKKRRDKGCFLKNTGRLKDKIVRTGTKTPNLPVPLFPSDSSL